MSQCNPSAEIRPFRGIRYDVAVAGDLSSLLCPPYDIIDAPQQRELYGRSPFNVIRLEHPLPTGDGCDELEKYRDAATIYRQWMRDGILVRDSSPALYVHDHSFEFRGRRHVRRGLIAAVRLRPWYQGVYPHELTGTKAKQDRLELMRACQASFSYPLGLYDDGEGVIARLLDEAVENTSLLEASGSGDGHRLRVIRDEAIWSRIQQAFVARLIYIADGHHRYETALLYRAERRERDGDDSAVQRSYDFIPMTLTAFNDPGLFISPIYRVLSGLPLPGATEIERRLSSYFTIDYVPLEAALARDAPVGEMAMIAVAGLRDGFIGELRPKPGVDLGAEIAGAHSSEYRTFNVSVLNHVMMAKILEVNPDGEGVAYSPDLGEVVRSVRAGEAQMAFLLAPAHPLLVKKIADQKERMPRKSTYFYPKPPTGLVAYPLD